MVLSKYVSVVILLGVFATAAAGKDFNQRGDVGMDHGCVIFETFALQDYVLYGNLPQLNPRTIYRVKGEEYPCEVKCGSGVTWRQCINVAEMTVSPPDTLGCGTMAGPYDPDDDCRLWKSPIYGYVEVGSVKGFAFGDTVLAIGYIRIALSYCMYAPLQLLYKTILPCDSAGYSRQPVTWGYIKARFR